MKFFRAKLRSLLTVPSTFEPDDLRMRRILNTILLAVIALGFFAGGTVFSYGDSFSETWSNSDARILVIVCIGFSLTCMLLFGMNRWTRIPKNLVGWLLVIGLTGFISISDTPEQLTYGSSIVLWTLPVVLSVAVLPPISVITVDIIITTLFAYFAGFQWSQFNVYPLAAVYTLSFLAWLSMSVAQRAIRDARNEASKNAAILDGVADGVVVVGQDNHVTLANPVALSLLNGQLADLVANTEDTTEVGRRVLSFQWSNVPGVGRVAIVRDISRLREIERARDAMLGVVSHEMRTPLAAISGFAELIAARPDKVRELAERIRVNAQRLMHMVNDLLDQAQIQAGALVLRREPYSTSALTTEIKNLFNGLACEKKVGLSITSSLPETLMGDADRVRQILVNLTNNGIKFTDSGGKVRVSMDVEDETWKIVVKDTGEGIPPERLPDIFEPFRRGSDYATRRHQGAGLGLSIVKQLANLMGGKVGVESEVGKGSIFTVTLPLDLGEAA